MHSVEEVNEKLISVGLVNDASPTCVRQFNREVRNSGILNDASPSVEVLNDGSLLSEEDDNNITDNEDVESEGINHDEENMVVQNERLNQYEFCQNCHRHQPDADVNELYQLNFQCFSSEDIIQRKYFRFVPSTQEGSNNTVDVILCNECSLFLVRANNNKSSRTFQYVWPSFFWNLLTNRKLQDIVGNTLWKFIPKEWRYWWMDSITIYDCYENITLELPTPYFHDVTIARESMRDSMKSKMLSSIAEACNEHLMPTLLCPWGDTEFLHTCGNIEMDIVIQRLLLWVQIPMVSSIQKLKFCASIRDDYLREYEDYDNLLCNPKWKIVPSIAFIEGKGPVMLTCRNHDGGTSKLYIHPPRTVSILPAQKGDQLSHVVTCPRTVKPMKACTYNTTFQMSEQKGSFQGIDTIDVCSVGDFSFCSHLTHENECRCISYRPDINSLLQKLCKCNLISKKAVKEMRDDARVYKEKMQGKEEQLLSGCTYMSLSDALFTQKELSQPLYSEMTIDGREGIASFKIQAPKNWPSVLYPVQKYDESGYGCHFLTIPSFNSKTVGTKLIWSLFSILLGCKELWGSTNNCKLHQSLWHGWVMAYISRKCIGSMSQQTHKDNPFKLKLMSKIETLVSRLGLQNNEELCYESMFSLMVHHSNVVCCKEISQVENEISNIDDTDIIIVVPAFDSINNYSETITVLDNIFEVRVMCTVKDTDLLGTKWNGSIFCRHGGDSYNNWWCQERNGKLSLKTRNGPFSPGFGFEDICISVYVKEVQKNYESIRQDLMRHIGGQDKFYCATHGVPLICSYKSNQKCVWRIEHICRDYCERKVHLCCPELNCSVGICKKCSNTVQSNGICQVVPPSEQYYNEIDIEGSDSSNSSVNSDQESLSSDISGLDDNDENDDDDDDMEFDPLITENFTSDGNNGIMSTDEAFEDAYTPRDDRGDENDDNFDDFIPTTNTADTTLEVEEVQRSENHYVSGHIILNQIGSLLDRPKHRICSTTSQKHFIQGLVSVIPGEPIPLIYPEAMMFPSIFWKATEQCCSILGAIPCSLLTNVPRQYGIANVKDHMQNRLCLSGTATSTSQHYIHFAYDSCVNLTLNNQDSRIVLNRGLTVAEDKTNSLQVKSRNDSSLSDSIDSKQMVKIYVLQ